MANPPDPPPPSSVETYVVEVDPRATRRHGVFTVASGLEAGKVLAIKQGEVVTLGRSSDCTHSFDDASLSREHARVMWVATDYFVRDEGSRNGTFVNNNRIAKAMALKDGDKVQLGSSTLLRFALVDDAEEAAMRRVYEAAILDGLTGVFNRKHFEERIAAEISHVARQGGVLAVAIVDVDHFKRVNDTFGHMAGDAVLKSVAGLLKSSVRPEDLVARYGGEEFVVVMRGTDSRGGFELADRLRRTIEASSVTFEGKEIRVTSSGGVASTADAGILPERSSLLGAADSRLYAAKNAGRNRVHSS